MPKLEDALKGSIDENTTLEDVQKIVGSFESPVSEGPYTNADAIKYYFDNQPSIWAICEKLEKDKTYEEFAAKTLEAMGNVCTVSKAVIFQNITTAKDLSLLGQFK